MTIKEFAKILRARQQRLGSVPRVVLRRLSDREIVDSYRFCSACGAELIATKKMEDIIARAAKADVEKIITEIYEHICRGR